RFRCVGTMCLLGRCRGDRDDDIGHALFLARYVMVRNLRGLTGTGGSSSRHYCPCAAPLTRLATDWARMARARPPRATYNALLAWTRWFSFWLAVMYSSAAQAKKKVAIARAKAVRSLYRLVKKPVMLPRMTSVFQLAFTRVVNCAEGSSAVAYRIFVIIGGISHFRARSRMAGA